MVTRLGSSSWVSPDDSLPPKASAWYMPCPSTVSRVRGGERVLDRVHCRSRCGVEPGVQRVTNNASMSGAQ